MADSEKMALKQGRKKSARRAPVCKAILLCDKVTRDEVTYKTNLIGIFDTFVLPAFPGPTAPCKIFLLLRDGIGRHSITAEVHDPERGLILFRSPGAGEFGSPGESASGELWLPIAALPFERPGTYAMVVFADGVEVARTPFKVKAE
jgi:hypothetical protein